MPLDAGQTSLRAAVLSGSLVGPDVAAAMEHVDAVRARAEKRPPCPDGAAGILVNLLLGDTLETALLWDVPRARREQRAALDRDIATIDALLAAQIDAILHDPAFQKLEALWRSLAWLGDLAHDQRWTKVRFRILSATWAELARDLSRASAFDQSELFRKLYEEEFGQAGGIPFGLMVVDHDVGPAFAPGAPVDDAAVLEMLRDIAAAAFLPTILGAAPALLELNSFADLQRLPDLDSLDGGRAMARLERLRRQPGTEFLAIAAPRILMRLPWQDDGRTAIPFRYNEQVPTAAQRLWASAGFAFAAVVARAFANNEWPADVRGSDPDRESGGLVTDLPVECYATDPPGVWPRLPLEVVLTDKQERSLVELGMMPVSALPFGQELLFGIVRSLRRPDRHAGAHAADADANARISAHINSVLCASRFAHHLKIMTRDMIGSAVTPDVMERRLQTWLDRYVNGSNSEDPELRARYPLVAGRVEVRGKPGMPGAFDCLMHLQPHFQLDDVGATFSLVTEIAPAAA